MTPQAHAKKKIEVSDIPKRIVKIAKDIFPHATLTRAKIVDDHGEYDVYGKLPDGTTFKIDFNDWEIEKTEEKLTEETVPQAIMDKLKDASPNFSFSKASKRSTDGKKFTYIIEVKTSGGNKNTYSFNQKMIMSHSVEKMTLAELPSTVNKAIEKAFPGSTIVHATRKTDYEKVFYELDITSANDTHILWTFPGI